MDRVMTFRLLAASVVVVVLAAACGIQTSLPTPTPTPTPRPPAGGIHTPEDVRAQYEGWPEGYKLALDEDVVVMFSYPSPITDWAGFAFINHIPSVSSVTLKRPAWVVGPGGTKTPMYLGRTKWYDGQEVVLRTHYGSEEGEKRLETVLSDGQLMQRILEGPPVAAPTPTPTPPEPDIVFQMKGWYQLGEPIEIRVRNQSGTDTYYYQSYYPACYNLKFFDASTERRLDPSEYPVQSVRLLLPGQFIVPKGTHCDLISENPLKPGEEVALLTWDQQMCIRDRWGCVESIQVSRGEYRIVGEFAQSIRVIGPGATEKRSKIVVAEWRFVID